MKVVTICGSMKFADEMIKISWDLETKFGYCVLQPIPFDGEITESDKTQIGKAHFKKIDISDAIYVVNIGGHIGSSTKAEIEYAKSHGKQVIFHEKAE